MTDTYAAYKQKVEAQFDTFQARVDALKAKAKDASADLRITLDQKVRELQDSIADARRDLADRDDDRKESWDAFRSKIDGIVDGIKAKLE